MIEGNKTVKLNCKKINPKGKILAVSGTSKPPQLILDVLKKYNVSSFTPMHSSYKFCVIATGEFDFYAAKERAYEWDYAEGHAVAVRFTNVLSDLPDFLFAFLGAANNPHGFTFSREQSEPRRTVDVPGVCLFSQAGCPRRPRAGERCGIRSCRGAAGAAAWRCRGAVLTRGAPLGAQRRSVYRSTNARRRKNIPYTDSRIQHDSRIQQALAATHPCQHQPAPRSSASSRRQPRPALSSPAR